MKADRLEEEAQQARARLCVYCGSPAVLLRAWCRPCLGRIRTWGIVDHREYPTEDDARSCGTGRLVDVM